MSVDSNRSAQTQTSGKGPQEMQAESRIQSLVTALLTATLSAVIVAGLAVPAVLAAGGDRAARSKEGQTPADVARRAPKPKMLAILKEA